MTQAGLAKLDYVGTQDDYGRPPQHSQAELVAPQDLQQALEAFPEALANFTRLPPSHRRRYLAWINDAKRPETRARRVAEAVQMLSKNQKLGI
jgi:uncharacterized protein YdeI (YjbR/CyaY-like superfamily)